MSWAIEAIWHDVECGAYTADLALWEDLAARSAAEDGSADVLDLGCGTGRVSLLLARRGHRVTALDLDPAVLGVLARRAEAENLLVEIVQGDASDFALGRSFDLVIAPMQLVQLFRGRSPRKALLERARAHLRPGGRFAAALLDLSGEPIDGDYAAPLPDVREVDGWVYSSQPIAIRLLDAGDAISLDRLRQAVSPDGELVESSSRIRLELITAAELEQEAQAAGLVGEDRVEIPPTEDHVGSTVVITRAGDD
jgi:SAM-dependent methyltransferase